MSESCIYLSGPMTGLPQHNYPCFHAAAKRFRDAGWDVFNPAESFGARMDLPREVYLRKDFHALSGPCDAIALLPGWRNSIGARAEYMLAVSMGLTIYDAVTMQNLEPLPVAVAIEGELL